MKSLLTLTGILLVLAAIGAFFYAGYIGAIYLWQVYAELDAVIRIVLLSIMSVGLITALILAAAIKTTSTASTKGQLFEAKRQLYKTLVEGLKPFFATPDQLSQQDYSQVQDNLHGIMAEIQILASAAVLDSVSKLEIALGDRHDAEAIIAVIEKLVKNIRRDLGHGANYDETRLKYLVSSRTEESMERTNPGVGV
ncbi:MAG: hypothetical protein GY820_45630 [Gammaproteobacteria bacterium]|nr:hypothetical protein [Gammaproteobacteria bacterium]